ncbi:MAG: 50S ribosomal protein L11 [Candidatus Diapherotrites archaeon]|nr:50S ribosomal protein L11 [Candidatus Diapherotrites archaeon]
MPEIKVLVEGGKASAGAPLGPALGPLGINIAEVVNTINEKTKAFEGMKVPVTVIVDPETKSFEVKVGSPPTSALIKKELNLQKAAKNPKSERVGNLSLEQVKKIAEMKLANMSSVDIKSAIREVIGTCQSMGVAIEGKSAKKMQELIAQGKVKI